MIFDYDDEQERKMPPAVRALYDTMVELQEESPRKRLAELFGEAGGKQIASWTGKAVGALPAEIFLTGIMVGAEYVRRNPGGPKDDERTDDGAWEDFKDAKETA